MGAGEGRGAAARQPALPLSSWVSLPVDGGRAVRSVNLLKVAFDAEVLRMRAMMARQGRRAAFAFIAVIFALAVLAWPR